jgi:integrase
LEYDLSGLSGRQQRSISMRTNISEALRTTPSSYVFSTSTLELCLSNLSTWEPCSTSSGRGSGKGVKTRTINAALEVVRRIVTLAATEWIDRSNLTWLQSPPKIRVLPIQDAREPYPLTWDEQDRLFKELPRHLATFAVNTGLRDREICTLRWDWEVSVTQLGASVFVIPRAKTMKGRLVALNPRRQTE